MRVGFGYDAHPLVDGRPLVLGGCVIPCERGLAGFSDADVVCHALIDALFGAAALGDCGSHFPAGDARFAGARSADLLRQAKDEVTGEGYRIVNADCTVVAEAPALAPHIGAMRLTLATALGVTLEQCSVKAKHTEGLGFVGEGRGIEAFAIVAIEQKR